MNVQAPRPGRRLSRAVLVVAGGLAISLALSASPAGTGRASNTSMNPQAGVCPGPNARPFLCGNEILFSTNLTGEADEIYVIDADGKGRTQLTDDSGDDFAATWNGIRTEITFVSDRDGNYEIYRMNTGGGEVRNLTHHDDLDIFPSFSPGGSKIAFVSTRGPNNNDGDFEIWTMNRDGTGLDRLTNYSVPSTEPDIRNDDLKIVFTSKIIPSGADYEIWAMNVTGTGLTQLTANAWNDRQPSWSHDGSKIAYVSTFGGDAEIYTMNSNGTAQKQLTNNTFEDQNPTWSRDGVQLAFESERGADKTGVYRMKSADGSNETLIPNTRAGGWPDWDK